MKKGKKKCLKVILMIVILLIVGGGLYFYNYMGYSNEGNSSKYDVKNVASIKNSPLSDKTIMFLGSSATVGMCSKGVSFVQYMEKRDSINVIEEAVSGTTLTTSSRNNYIYRMKKNLNKNVHVDCFVCQLSTNDVTFKKPLGKISSSKNINDFDTTTVTGAIEYVIAYAKQTWNCPVVFYTDTYYGSNKYEEMTDVLLQLQKKWNIGVIDLLNNEDMKKVDKNHYEIYMANSIHPTKAGYLEWWTPVMERYLYDYLK